jgi:c-di-GMP-binding flagellar brake protein YcgR
MDRNDSDGDRRRYKRVAFTASDEISGLVQFPNEAKVRFKIADIGSGGLRFIPLREEAIGIQPGTQLFLIRIQGYKRLKFLSLVKLIVRWIIDEAQFAHVMVGCEFMEFSEKQRQQIDRFIDAETKISQKNI